MLPTNVIPFEPRDRRWLRPRGAGLLPTRIFAATPESRALIERRIGRPMRSMTSGVAALDDRRGFWRCDRDTGNAIWVGLRTDAHAPVALSAGTHLPLDEAFAALAALDLAVEEAVVLCPDTGWAQAPIAAPVPQDVEGKSGMALLCCHTGSSEPWCVEIYSNACLWAESKARSESLAEAFLPLVQAL
jgi:hypothetical protein